MAVKMVTLGKREDLQREASGVRLHHERERQRRSSTRSARNTPTRRRLHLYHQDWCCGDAAEMAIIELACLCLTSPVQEIGTGMLLLIIENHRLCRWRCPAKVFLAYIERSELLTESFLIIESFR